MSKIGDKLGRIDRILCDLCGTPLEIVKEIVKKTETEYTLECHQCYDTKIRVIKVNWRYAKKIKEIKK